MILKLILSALLLYYLCVLWKYYRTDIAGLLGKTDAEERTDEPDEEAEKPGEPYTVIGKSTYRKRQTYEPEDKRGHTENQADKTDNFASGTPETATDNGTEQAEESAADEDADYSDIEVEPEEDEPEEEGYVPTPEELEEEEELGAYYPDSNPDFATGYTFEDLKMVHRVITTDDADSRRNSKPVRCCPP